MSPHRHAPSALLAVVIGAIAACDATPPATAPAAPQAALGITAAPDSPGATATGRRTTPDVFGFGLLDAVPDAEIVALADPYDLNGDGISGRVHRTADGRIGRFGRKAQEASLR